MRLIYPVSGRLNRNLLRNLLRSATIADALRSLLTAVPDRSALCRRGRSLQWLAPLFGRKSWHGHRRYRPLRISPAKARQQLRPVQWVQPGPWPPAGSAGRDVFVWPGV